MTRPLTPHQERWQAARQRNRDTAVARHDAELAKLDGKLREVLDHHRPTLPTGNRLMSSPANPDPECEGCDWGAYADGPADWPCSTWALITAEDQAQWSPPIEDAHLRGAILGAF